MPDLGSTMRILRPLPNVLVFYDGRIVGQRAHSSVENWLDDGAFALGVCTFVIVDDGEALVYDTHISIPHARIVRDTVEAAGFTIKCVVLSHWHTDHVAGNEVFADCPIIANTLTRQLLEEHRAALEAGDPPIGPLVMPTETFDGERTLQVGGTTVLLRQADIHSRDGTVLLLPRERMLLAGDTLEDTVTYVAEPERLEAHLRDLDRMRGWDFDRIWPNHGAEDLIAGEGYDRRLIDATQRYVERLLRCPDDAALAACDLRSFAAEDIASGAIRYFEPYEQVHRRNVRRVLESRPPA